MKEIGKERKIAITALIIAVLMLTVAFAAMSRTLKINGTAKVDSAAWDIRFTSANMTNKKGDARQVAEPVIDDGGINLTLKVGLRKPKDEITYEAVIENLGDIDAEIESIQYPELTEDQAKIIEFEATYDDGSEISKSQELKATEEKTVKIVIRYKDITDESLLAKETYDIPLTFKINYIQSGLETENIPGGEIVDDGSKAVLAYTDIRSAVDPERTPFANSPIGRWQIETLSFVKGSNSARTGNTWDASEAGDGSITGYYQDSDSNGLYEVVIESASNIYAPVDAFALFGFCASLKEINFNNFRTDDTTNMRFMFGHSPSLTNLDLSSFNTSNVTSMIGMFQYSEFLTSLDLSSFDTSSVTNMYRMFSGCSKLQTLNISHFNTENVTDMSYMFENCSSLTGLDLSSFNTSNVTVMENMFYACLSLTSINLSKFNTSKVTTMEEMFYRCENLEIIDLKSWNIKSVTNMFLMFGNCVALKSIDLSTWDTSNVTDMGRMFYRCDVLTELKLNRADFSSGPSHNNMFYNVSNITIYVKDQAAIDFLSTTDVENATYKIEPLQS